jgi:hypothetical protein
MKKAHNQVWKDVKIINLFKQIFPPLARYRVVRFRHNEAHHLNLNFWKIVTENLNLLPIFAYSLVYSQ